MSKVKQIQKTPEQKQFLRKAFQQNPRPQKPQITELATQTGLTFSQVKEWFRREREKVTKQQQILNETQSFEQEQTQGNEIEQQIYDPLGFQEDNGRYVVVNSESQKEIIKEQPQIVTKKSFFSFFSFLKN